MSGKKSGSYLKKQESLQTFPIAIGLGILPRVKVVGRLG